MDSQSIHKAKTHAHGHKLYYSFFGRLLTFFDVTAHVNVFRAGPLYFF